MAEKKKAPAKKRTSTRSQADINREARELARQVISDKDKKAADRAGVSKRYYREFGQPRIKGGRLLVGETSRKIAGMIKSGKIKPKK